MNEGVPYKKAQEIEKDFKELHAGLYTWGTKVLNESIAKGYIESADGWKLKLPKFDIYKTLESKIKEISRNEWMDYKEGKLEYQRWKKSKEEGEKPYTVKNQICFDYYQSKKMDVSGFFKLKSEYSRLALNNPKMNGCLLSN